MFKELFTESNSKDKKVQAITDYIYTNFEKKTTKQRIKNDTLEIETSRALTDGETEKIMDKFSYVSGVDHSYDNVMFFQMEWK